MGCPYCGSVNVGLDWDYTRHKPSKAEHKTVGSETYCIDCGKYVFPANKWLVGKIAKNTEQPLQSDSSCSLSKC